MREIAQRFLKNDTAAVAPTVTLALFGLVAAGGMAFDYARMASLDTELQNAADQAAIAAAGQLDGRAGARTRATSAAQSLVQNLTYFSNDGGSTAVTVPTVIFYSGYNEVTGVKSPLATADTDADYVEVTVGVRRANYALTPVVALLSSGDMSASAFAGISSAICNTPPVMICNPDEPLGNTDVDLGFNIAEGTGIRLIAGNADAPGNFGFLETGFGNGAQNLARALGYNSPPGECAPTDGVTTKPGLNATVMDAVNTRFDLSANGANTCPTGGTCSPSRNVRKDLVRNNSCSTTNPNGWQESPDPYRPTTITPLPTSGVSDPDIMGHPRDNCHAVSNAGTCARGRIGTGSWDRNAFFRVNYGWDSTTWQTNTGLSSTASRYDIYVWEMANPTQIDTVQIVSTGPPRNGHGAPVCRVPGITPGGLNVDRRRISAAVINCVALGLNGSETDVQVRGWIDLFLVEPAWRRTSPDGTVTYSEATDIYVEMIGTTSFGSNGSTTSQVIRRDVPRLIE